ncbi:Hypothetical protein SMAX5B_002905 [Scophthalmus maximus]|uniref:Uncharacterized protein n=1 Tax=Scophthalmus maximus TaxID=52904 RepID=A0A2U9BX93_SCOMX|nr:Hypothetical protein SMAX5B_002905 [Scophthalmus maximus]
MGPQQNQHSGLSFQSVCVHRLKLTRMTQLHKLELKKSRPAEELHLCQPSPLGVSVTRQANKPGLVKKTLSV